MLPHAIANYEPYLYLRLFSTMPIIHCKCRSTEISIITFLLYILMIRLYHYACIFPILKIVTKSQIVHTNGIYNVLRTYLLMLTFPFIPITQNCRISNSNLYALKLTVWSLFPEIMTLIQKVFNPIGKFQITLYYIAIKK